jgi:UrcA family protein
MTTTMMTTAVAVRRRVRAGLLIAAVAALLPAAAVSAAERDEPLSTVVRYGDLDIESEAGAEALYRRLQLAARRVCPGDSRDLAMRAAVRACRAQAIERAVGSIGSTRLAAVQSARKRVS